MSAQCVERGCAHENCLNMPDTGSVYFFGLGFIGFHVVCGHLKNHWAVDVSSMCQAIAKCVCMSIVLYMFLYVRF